MRFAGAQQQRWRAFWRGLELLGVLGPREAELVADAARQGLAQNFTRETAPDGTPWAALAQRTQAERARGIDRRGIPFRVGKAHPILRRTGDLRDSFIDPRHPRNITWVLRTPGVTVLVLGAHENPQTPGRIGGLTETMAAIPPRPFIGLSAAAEAQVGAQAWRVLCQRVERLFYQ